MKLTTKLLKKLIKEELNKMNESGRASYTGPSHDNNPYKIIDGPGWSIAVDSRQNYGIKALNGEYDHPETKKLITASRNNSGQTMADIEVPAGSGNWGIGVYYG
tara:strand:+ start:510 stop:821 length:312 start_codon:yes stop_codon:yes gene_type:complete